MMLRQDAVRREDLRRHGHKKGGEDRPPDRAGAPKKQHAEQKADRPRPKLSGEARAYKHRRSHQRPRPAPR